MLQPAASTGPAKGANKRPSGDSQDPGGPQDTSISFKEISKNLLADFEKDDTLEPHRAVYSKAAGGTATGPPKQGGKGAPVFEEEATRRPDRRNKNAAPQDRHLARVHDKGKMFLNEKKEQVPP